MRLCKNQVKGTDNDDDNNDDDINYDDSDADVKYDVSGDDSYNDWYDNDDGKNGSVTTMMIKILITMTMTMSLPTMVVQNFISMECVSMTITVIFLMTTMMR